MKHVLRIRAFVVMATFLTLLPVDLLGVDIGDKAPSFSLSNIKNEKRTLRDYKGKVLYIDFWASWCKACKRSFPWMNRIQDQYGGSKFQVIAINLDQDKESSADFIKEYGGDLEILIDPKGVTPEAFSVVEMPSSYLVDTDGSIVAVHQGFNRDIGKEIEITLKGLLKGK